MSIHYYLSTLKEIHEILSSNKGNTYHISAEPGKHGKHELDMSLRIESFSLIAFSF